MRSHKIVAVAAAVGAAAVLSWSAGSTVEAQAPAGRGAAPAKPTTPTPRLPDGTVNLGRVPGEKGVWNLPYITNMGARVIDPATGKPFAVLKDVGPAGKPVEGRGGAPAEPFVPFQPWAAAMYNYNTLNSSKYDPEGFCLPPGGPRLFATPYPAEIIQMPDKSRIFQVFEGGAHIWREIYTDGREHPKGDALPLTWLGHSVGKWEGDTLVVDVVGFHEGTWLDYFGHPHSDQLHVVEKYTRPNKETLHYEALIDDPGAYTKPFTVAWDISWNNDDELTEYICQENNRFLLRLKDDFGEPLFGAKPHKE